MFLKSLNVLFFALLPVMAFGSPPDTIKLDDVTVSVIPFQDKYDKATGALTNISVKGTDFKQVINPSELINLVPGVFMASGTYNTNRLIIRGIGSRTPYSSNRIRAYLDEIPLTSGDGTSTLEDIDIAGIGNIHILKGPASALYGSGLGGVAILTPFYPTDQGWNISLTNGYGSFGTSRNNISIGYKKNRVTVHSGISRSSSNGYRENSKYLRNNLFLNAHYFGERTNISLIISIADLFGQIPSSLNEEDFLSNPEKAADNWNAVNGFEEYMKLTAGLKINNAFGRNFENTLVIFSNTSDPYESRPFNILDDRSLSAGFREYMKFERDDIKFRIGLEYFNEWYNWQIFETLEGEQGDLQSRQQEKRRYFNTFTMFQWRPFDHFIIDAGANLNLLHYELETIYRQDSLDNSGSYSYDPVLSPRIGINYRFKAEQYLYASIGHGFSAPSVEETLLPEGIINTDLRPESGWNLELGIRGHLVNKRISYDATIYSVFLKNLLVTERTSEDIFTGMNAGSARNLGVEFLTQVYLTSGGDLSPFQSHLTAGIAISDNRFREFKDDGADYSGNFLPGIPKQLVHLTLFSKFEAFEARLQYRFTGEQWMTDLNDKSYENYHIVNFQVAWKYGFSEIPFGLELFGGIKNLLNEKYASMILVNAPSFGANPPRYYYPGLPRQFHAGITIKFLSRN